MPASTPTKASWEPEHDLGLLRAVVHLVLSNRSALYATPILADVNHNGGDKINKRIQILLGRLVEKQKGAEGMVKEEVGKIGRGGNKRKATEAISEGDTPTKPSPKQRKARVKKVVEEVEDQEESAEEE